MVISPNKAKLHSSFYLLGTLCSQQLRPSHLNLSQQFASRVLALSFSSNSKLIRRIADNMRMDLEKHKQAHTLLEKMRFSRETATTRSFSHLNQI